MKGKIFINGLIGEHDGESGVFLADVIAQVKKQPEATSFDVHINSEGGLVSTGFDIYNYLRSLGLPITTIGEGVVASIATVIFMAGSERMIRPNTLFMIHLPMGGISGTADEISEYASGVKKVEKQIIDFYVSTLSLQKEAIEPLLKDETFLTEEQLAGLGITNSQALGVVAKAFINVNINKKPMKNTNKNKSILAKLRDLLSEEGDGVKNKLLYDANNNELVFADLEEDASVSIGDQATLNGEPAEGEITLADGTVITFSSGVVEAVSETSTDDETADTELVENLKKEIEELKAERDAVVAKYDAMKESNDKKAAIINKIKALESDFETEPTDRKKEPLKQNKQSRFKTALTNLKKQ